MATFRTFQQIAGWAGWASLAFVAFATLSPIEMRPTVAEIGIEHFGAFALIGVLLMTAYPRHALPIALLVVGAAVLLEIGQLFVPGRHGRVVDALVKLSGGLAGVAAARLLGAVLPVTRP